MYHDICSCVWARAFRNREFNEIAPCLRKLFTKMYVTFFHRKGAFTNYVDKFLAFFDHLSLCVDIFYLINIDKKSNFLGLPTLST